jgi:hypothetical protein
MSASESRASPWSGLGSAVGTLVTALTLLGVITYAVIAAAYEDYYRAFDLTLAEVGLGYTQVLYSSVAVLAATALLISVLGSLAVAVAPASWLEPLHRPRRRLVALGLLIALLIVWVMAVLLQVLAYRRGQDVFAGESVGSISILGARVLNVSAELTTVVPIDPKGQRPFPSRLLYLGTSNANHILWDPDQREVISVPASTVRLEMKATTDGRGPVDVASRGAVRSDRGGGRVAGGR